MEILSRNAWTQIILYHKIARKQKHYVNQHKKMIFMIWILNLVTFAWRYTYKRIFIYIIYNRTNVLFFYCDYHKVSTVVHSGLFQVSVDQGNLHGILYWTLYLIYFGSLFSFRRPSLGIVWRVVFNCKVPSYFTWQ